jgi:hypothetical protein
VRPATVGSRTRKAEFFSNGDEMAQVPKLNCNRGAYWLLRAASPASIVW